MPAGLIITGAVQLLDIIFKHTSKHPETVPELAPTVGTLVAIASRAAGETPEETAARLARHDALVAQYAAAPPPGANVPSPSAGPTP